MFKKKISLIIGMLIIINLSLNNINASYPNGNKLGESPIPEEAFLENISKPDHIIGTGTPESCTSEAFIEAVSKGGTIVFNGGSEPFTIELKETAKIFNNEDPDIVIDGGGLVTLSGGGVRRILYMNTADPNQVWTTSHAQNQDHPRLTIQNITFANGNSTGEEKYTGGGAVWVRGGRFKVINCIFVNNVCRDIGPDVGGGAIRVFDQYEDLPVYIVNTTFGGSPGRGNIASNGGAISSIGVSWTIINSLFSYNEAIGNGGNPQRTGTPGGGSGGAIYNDGNEMRLTLKGSVLTDNSVNTHGSGIFFVTNNHSGDIVLENSVVSGNTGGSWYPVHPNISCHSDTIIEVSEFSEAELVHSIAIPTEYPVLVNGINVSFTAYNVKDNNYFKLRDIAMLLKGSNKGFEVVWDSSDKAIKMTSNTTYTEVGEELSVSEIISPLMYTLNRPIIKVDDKLIELRAYNVKGYNYFKLRDIAKVFDFGVLWNNNEKLIEINTLENYTY